MSTEANNDSFIANLLAEINEIKVELNKLYIMRSGIVKKSDRRKVKKKTAKMTAKRKPDRRKVKKKTAKMTAKRKPARKVKRKPARKVKRKPARRTKAKRKTSMRR